MDYKPLSLVNDEIRLIQIEPSGDPDAELRCQLLQMTLASARNYVALSYCWGNPNSRRRVVVSNWPTMVTTSLEEALRELRRRAYLYVWADALCINQENKEERSQQVLRMAGIYRSASKVVAFLTCDYPSDPNVLSALFQRVSSEAEEIKRAQREYKKRKKELDLRPKKLWSSSSSSSKDRIIKPPRQSVKFSDNEGTSFLRLLLNPYWRRAWIIQEVATNPDLEIIWGQEVFKLNIMVKVAQLATRSDIFEFTRQLRYLQDIYRIRIAQLNMAPPSILEVLAMARDAKASEARDRIYAILGVTSNGSILVPVPSYTLPESEINKDMTIRMIRTTKLLDFLLLKHDCVGTWYMNWFDRNSFSHKRIKSFTRVSKDEALDEKLFDACNQQAARFEVKENSLAVEGFFIDNVTSCSPTLEEARQVEYSRALLKDIKRSKAHISAPHDLNWLMSRIHLGIFGRTSTKISTGSASCLLTNLDGDTETSQTLIQWLHCCLVNSFMIKGHHVASWFSQNKNHWGERRRKRVIKRLYGILDNQTRLGMTARGRLGWFNRNTIPGDKIAILSGCRLPAVLRKCGDHGYCVVGGAIVEELMFGAAAEEERRWEPIELVNA